MNLIDKSSSIPEISPGCQRLFTRGFLWPLAASAFGRHGSIPPEARKNLMYPGYRYFSRTEILMFLTRKVGGEHGPTYPDDKDRGRWGGGEGVNNKRQSPRSFSRRWEDEVPMMRVNDASRLCRWDFLPWNGGLKKITRLMTLIYNIYMIRQVLRT